MKRRRDIDWVDVGLIFALILLLAAFIFGCLVVLTPKPHAADGAMGGGHEIPTSLIPTPTPATVEWQSQPSPRAAGQIESRRATAQAVVQIESRPAMARAAAPERASLRETPTALAMGTGAISTTSAWALAMGTAGQSKPASGMGTACRPKGGAVARASPIARKEAGQATARDAEGKGCPRMEGAATARIPADLIARPTLAVDLASLMAPTAAADHVLPTPKA
ncbi:unnamed protein product [Durusdinium trenchii]|uniref:Uncharacterized protein n=1 Tax=Durusdinium trenchii TaxID=1381693 RepID=A0ABP0LMF4_9DINO